MSDASHTSQAPYLTPHLTSYVYPTYTLGHHPPGLPAPPKFWVPEMKSRCSAVRRLPRKLCREYGRWKIYHRAAHVASRRWSIGTNGKGRTRVYTRMMLLGLAFQSIMSWQDFKAKLRTKFRGVRTPEHFFAKWSFGGSCAPFSCAARGRWRDPW